MTISICRWCSSMPGPRAGIDRLVSPEGASIDSTGREARCWNEECSELLWAQDRLDSRFPGLRTGLSKFFSFGAVYRHLAAKGRPSIARGRLCEPCPWSARPSYKGLRFRVHRSEEHT